MGGVARRAATLVAVFLSAAPVSSVLSPAARADIIPPGVREAEQRLRDDPKTFDRVDQFCAKRRVGAACEAELTVDGKLARNAGVCARVTESAPRFYFRGWQVATRDVVQCLSAKPVVRDLKPVSWWQKVRQ